MAPRTIEAKSTAAYFAQLSPDARATALAARDLVRRAAPDLIETVCMGVPHWGGNDWVVYIADYARHVNLGFHKGAKIKDTTGLLEGTGKGLRHVKLVIGAPLPDQKLTALVRKAVAIDKESAQGRI